jgi:hypothetical protein
LMPSKRSGSAAILISTVSRLKGSDRKEIGVTELYPTKNAFSLTNWRTNSERASPTQNIVPISRDPRKSLSSERLQRSY